MQFFKTIFFFAFLILTSGCREHNEPAVIPQPEVVVPPAPVEEPKAPVIVGGSCDGCELMYVGMPTQVHSIDTSLGWTEKGKKLIVSGTVYKANGLTPAPDVIIYYWQTDSKGYYSPKKDLNELAKRHGHIRGWVKTDQDGKYSIYTSRPMPYPNETIPAHIHLVVKEPNIGNEYYVDDVVFDDDKLLTPEQLALFESRGGSGVVTVTLKDKIQLATHDIILGRNIPDYPKSSEPEPSGLEIGEEDPSFTPYHAFGPDKGTWTCPLCKYGGYYGIIYFVGNHPDWEEIKKWVLFLEQESLSRSAYLKAFFVYGNENDYSEVVRQKELEDIGTELDIKYVALTFVPSMHDTLSEVFFNRINPNVGNTFIVYEQGEIVDKYVDLAPTPENYKRIVSTIDNSMKEFLNIKAPRHQ